MGLFIKHRTPKGIYFKRPSDGNFSNFIQIKQIFEP